MRPLLCDTHGLKPWHGQVVCWRCQRVYTTHDAKLPSHAPIDCACGWRLMPGTCGDVGLFTARPCCTECYEQRTKVLS